MKAPQFAQLFAQLPKLNQPQRWQVLAALVSKAAASK
ncbi:hypothetical protein ABIB38_001676 [Massilia sp. UYP11]